MISTRFIDYIILNSKMQLEVTEGQKVASNSKNKIKIRKCTYICHFFCGGQTLNLEKGQFHMIPKSIIKQSYE